MERFFGVLVLLICVECTSSIGPQGDTGTPGRSEGIQVLSAPIVACAKGGTEIKTFLDQNENQVLDANETILQTSYICNGHDGQNGTDGNDGHDGSSASISIAQASPQQCSAGGLVIATSSSAGATADVVCNGVAGQNGTNGVNGINGILSSGPVGSQVSGNVHACHHDYLYLNNGWLLFRHEDNGTSDQGAGTTGFNVWNVEIPDFLLISEVGHDTYCSLHFDAQAKTLGYSVLTNENHKQGEAGFIQLF